MTIPPRCPLCESTATAMVWEENGYRGWGCGCGLVFIDPLPEPADVDLTKDLHSEEFYRYPARVRVGFVERVHPGGRLLEVGCGGGANLEAARRSGYQVAGMEADPEQAAHTAARLGVPVEARFIEESTAPAEGFDVVYHLDLLSHFPDPVAALRAMTDQLRPGGVVCFEAGAFGGLDPRWYRWLGGVGFPLHRWLYSEDAVRATVARADLEVIRVERFSLLASHAFTFVRRLGSRLARSAQVDPTSNHPGPSRMRRWCDRVEFNLTYRIGRLLPRVGPQALFVAARPVSPPPPSPPPRSPY